MIYEPRPSNRTLLLDAQALEMSESSIAEELEFRMVGKEDSMSLNGNGKRVEEALILSGIRFHHFDKAEQLSLLGVAHLAYLPSGRSLVSRSKLSGLLHKRLGLPTQQAEMTGRIADTIHDHCEVSGVALILRGEYYRGRPAGTEPSGAVLQTVALRGRFHTEPELQSGILQLLTGDSC